MAHNLHPPPLRMPFRLPLRGLLALALLISFGGSTIPSRAQSAADPAETAVFDEQVSVGYVLVPVAVREGARYLQSLDQKDFRLLVDGKPAVIDSFERRADAPASLIVLQDLSGSMGTQGRMDLSRKAAQFFLDRANPGDEFAIASFADDGQHVDVPFTRDLGALGEAVATWEAYGKTALHDALVGLPDISLAGRNPKRFAILITDGVDNASVVSPIEAREIVQKAQLPVFVLGLDSGTPFALDETGKKVYRYADVLNLLAEVTGGRYYPITNASELDAALVAIYEEVRHQYVLGFATGDGSDRFRRLEVVVPGRRSTRSIEFRRGYTGPPPAPAG